MLPLISWWQYIVTALKRQKAEDALLSSKTPVNLKLLFQRAQPFIKKYWPAAVFGLGIVLSSSLLSYPQPLIYRFLIDHVLLGRQLNLLFIVVIGYALLVLLQTGFGLLQRVYFTRFEQKVLLDIQHKILNRVLHFPKSFFDSQETGYLMSRLSGDLQGLRYFFSITIISIISNALRFIFGLGFLFYLEWRVAIASLIVLPLLALTVSFFSKNMYALSHQNMEKNARIYRKMQESLSSIPLIKSYVTEKHEIGRIMHEAKEAQNINLQSTVVNSVAGFSINFLREGARFIVLILGGVLIIRGSWTLGSLLAFQSYLAYVYEPANFFAQTNFSLQSALAALERISAFYDILPEENKSRGLKISHLKGKIDFNDVSFSYDGKNNILEHISFNIAAGEHIAIIGPSGAGKTTLISLILGFYRSQAGQILFDNLPLEEYALEDLRLRIGYVAQNTRLLSCSIMDNLKYGNISATEEEVVRAAQIAGIHNFVANLPDKYQATLGENGVNLSEGQKQRLSLARALVKNPDILILDEPTASQDYQTEKSIFSELPSAVQGKTLIIIAHRLSTIKESQRILVINEKKLIAQGSHAELLVHCNFFKNLVYSQKYGKITFKICGGK